MPNRLGIAVGETSIDMVLVNESTGQAHSAKVESATGTLANAVAAGVQRLIGNAGISAGEISSVIHGTTDPTKIAGGGGELRIGLLTTRGFEHVLQLGRGKMGEPTPPRTIVRSIDERISSDGNRIEEVNEDAAHHALHELLQARIDVLAICLTNAHANPDHELHLQELASAASPNLPVFLSHQVAAVAGEHGRMLATVHAARARAAVAQYVDTIVTGLRAADAAAATHAGQSLGTYIPDTASPDHPMNTFSAVEAAAAMAAGKVAERCGHPDALSLDIGGAATGISLIRGGASRISGSVRTAMGPLPVPAVDVRQTGTGGNARAHQPVQGLVQLTADGRGPSLLQAAIVLGLVPRDHVPVDAVSADAAVGEFAAMSGTGRERAAEGLLGLFHEEIAGELRLAATAKGEDPARLALVCSGGAGPLHGAAIADAAGIETVIVPRNAAALGADGLAISEPGAQIARSVGRTLDAIEATEVADILADLHATALTRMDGVGGTPTYRAELGYRRDAFRMSLPVDDGTHSDGQTLNALRGQFVDGFRRRNGRVLDRPVELLTLSASVRASNTVTQTRGKGGGADPRAAKIGATQVWFSGSFVTAKLFDRKKLSPGNRIDGPALVLQTGTTTVIPPGQTAEVSDYLDLVIRKTAGAG